MLKAVIAILFFLAVALPGLAGADALTAIIQQDLATLGYDPGNLDGEATTQTIVAVSKFQAEHDMEVTGEITPQLAGVIKAAISQQGQPATASVATKAMAATPAPAAQDSAALRAAQQACLQQKVADAQEAQKRKRGLGSLMRAVSRTASRLGGNDVASAVAETSADIYTAGAVAGDLASAAEDLGLTEDDVEACRNP